MAAEDLTSVAYNPQPASVPSALSPWAPLDPVVDPDRQSNLLRRVQLTTVKLERSCFYRIFLCWLTFPEVRDGIARAIASASEIRLVLYGVGSIESKHQSRLQLALALLMRRDLGPVVSPVEVFDPILSATECAVLADFGCQVLLVNEKGQREVDVPTLFFMPHCQAGLYDALLATNWRPSRLNRMVVLGNSFTSYAQYIDDENECPDLRRVLKLDTQHVLSVRRYVREVEIYARRLTIEVINKYARELKREEKSDGQSLLEEDDGEADMYFAFIHLNWHFFEVQDDVELVM